jgi:hypothetical protein
LAYAEGIPTAEAFTSKDGHPGVGLRLRVTDVKIIKNNSKVGNPAESTEINVDDDRNSCSPNFTDNHT